MKCKEQILSNQKKAIITLDTYGLEEEILEWVKVNDWHYTKVMTNKHKLQVRFGNTIGYINWQLGRYERLAYLQSLSRCWDNMITLCELMDLVSRNGCRTKEDLGNILHTHFKVITTAFLLSDMLKSVKVIVEEGDEPMGREPEWITYTQAADFLSVSKSTVSRWSKKGILRSNHRRGRHKRISKTSVILWKRTQEEEQIVRDLRRQRYKARK